MPAAVDPSARSTSTSMPTFSPTKGSTALTQGMDRRASHFALHHSCAEPCHALLCYCPARCAACAHTSSGTGCSACGGHALVDGARQGLHAGSTERCTTASVEATQPHIHEGLMLGHTRRLPTAETVKGPGEQPCSRAPPAPAAPEPARRTTHWGAPAGRCLTCWRWPGSLWG